MVVLAALVCGIVMMSTGTVMGQACVSRAFRCCRIVNYPVMGMLADQWDKQTCQIIDIMLRGKLANYSRACQQAYIDSFCLSTIAQCCPDKPVGFICFSNLVTITGQLSCLCQCLQQFVDPLWHIEHYSLQPITTILSSSM